MVLYKLLRKPIQYLIQRFPLFFHVLHVLFLIIIFYGFSITLTFYNKKYITMYPYPLSITVLHLIVKFLMAWFCRVVYELSTGSHRVQLRWHEYGARIAPAGLASSLDIGISNWSFEFITVSLYTMTKSTSVIFILLFAILFKLERKRCSLVFVVLFIAGGLCMFTYKSTQFNLEGFLLVLLASFISGIRWTLAQLVTQKTELGLTNPVDMIYHLQPWMLLSLLPLAIGMEGLEVATARQFFLSENLFAIAHNVEVLLLGAGLAFFLECSEFLLISKTSSLTLSIAGIFKEICTMLIASQWEPIHFVNAVGCAVCLMGISLHVLMQAKDEKPLIDEPYRSRSRLPSEKGA